MISRQSTAEKKKKIDQIYSYVLPAQISLGNHQKYHQEEGKSTPASSLVSSLHVLQTKRNEARPLAAPGLVQSAGAADGRLRGLAKCECSANEKDKLLSYLFCRMVS